MRQLLPILGFLILAACSQPSSGPSSGPGTTRQPPPRSVSEPEILEAVFRHQFEHNASGIRDGARRYCLTWVGGEDPDADFLRRFAGHNPPVVAGGQCDRASGKDLVFQAKIEEWVSDSEAVVRGGYWESGVSSSRETFRVVWDDGRWVVRDGRMEVIS